MADTAPCSVQPGFTVGIIGLCHSARRPLQLGFLWDTPSQLPAFRLALTMARIRIGKGAGGACRQPLSRCLQSFQRGTAVLEEPGPLVQTPKHPLLRPGAPWVSLEQDHGRPQAQRCGTRCWCVSASLCRSSGAGWCGTSAPSGPAQHLIPTAAGCTWPSSPEPHGSQEFQTRKCAQKAAGDNLWPLRGCALTRPM